MGLDEVTGQEEECLQRSSPPRSFLGGALCFSVSHTAVLWQCLKITKEVWWLSASLDAACLELVPLPHNQKALRGDTRRRAHSVMCGRVNPGPSLKSFIKETKKSICFHRTVEFYLLSTGGKKKPQLFPQSLGWGCPLVSTNGQDPLNPKSIFQSWAHTTAFISSSLFS